MKLSIIIPTFNRDHTLQRALLSVLAQISDDCEVIVVDDGSSTPVATHEDPRVRVQRLPKNLGAAAARNQGVEQASGQWISFLDSDDYWLEGRFDEIQQTMVTKLETPTVFLSAVIRAKNGKCIYHRVANAGHKTPLYLGGCRGCPGSAMLLKKSTFQRVGNFDEALQRLEDFDWFYRFFEMGGEINQQKKATVFIDEAGGGDLTRVAPSICRLRSKISQPPPITTAYFHLELARASLYSRSHFKLIQHLLASLWFYPRFKLQIQPVVEQEVELPQGR